MRINKRYSLHQLIFVLLAGIIFGWAYHKEISIILLYGFSGISEITTPLVPYKSAIVWSLLGISGICVGLSVGFFLDSLLWRIWIRRKAKQQIKTNGIGNLQFHLYHWLVRIHGTIPKSMRIIKGKRVHAKKPYGCFICGKLILPGEEYNRITVAKK